MIKKMNLGDFDDLRDIISHQTPQPLCNTEKQNLPKQDTKLHLVWACKDSFCTNLHYFIPENRLEICAKKNQLFKMFSIPFWHGKHGKKPFIFWRTGIVNLNKHNLLNGIKRTSRQQHPLGAFSATAHPRGPYSSEWGSALVTGKCSWICC